MYKIIALSIATSLALISTYANSSTLIEAFGYKLGESTNTSNLKKIATKTHAGDEYSFSPDNLYGVFNDYRIRVTPKTNRVFFISAKGEVKNRAECESEFGAVSSVLDKKYGKGTENLAAQMAGIKQLRYKGSNGRIVVQCLKVLQYEISVNYISDKVEKAAISERGELKSSSRNNSVL